MFSAEMNLLAGEQLALEQALRRAIGTGQIYLDYQPIMDMNTGQVSSLESLVRWRHPELGLIPPAQFIPAAEKSDLILELGQCILRTVLADLRDWLDAGVPLVPIAVNVSPCQLERTDFPALVAQLAAEKDIERQWLNFEITETVLLKEPDRIVGTLRQIREAGSKVLIDDFGVGYSSLNYLNRLPIDVLKIDQSFVRDIVIDSTRLPIVRAIIEMAHNLGLRTVAEGIEAADQLVILTELGCDFAQGYFLSRPMAAKHCRAMLTQMRGSRSLTETIMARALAS
jgi:EAL domain-containing protein (putative c-di-GMP-specific phosphodiesterase class I)